MTFMRYFCNRDKYDAKTEKIFLFFSRNCTSSEQAKGIFEAVLNGYLPQSEVRELMPKIFPTFLSELMQLRPKDAIVYEAK